MNIVVDTGAWYALADRSDIHHKRAAEFYTAQIDSDRFLATNLILAETWSLIASHLNRQAAIRFWQTVREARMTVWTVETVDLESAWQILQAFPDHDFSLVDCTTFALMERYGVHEAFAFDSHFLVYRFGANRQKAFRRHPQ
ncbi:MAG: PIN domain-containing protein [Acidobacteriota bacterium]